MVARRCQVCRSPKRVEIDALILEGKLSLQSIGEQFEFPKTAIWAHKTYHMKPEADVREHLAHADHLVKRLIRYSKETEKIFKAVRDIKDYDLALQAIARIEHQILLQAKLLGELRNATTININILELPAWRQLQSILTDVLKEYPEALAAVATALRDHLGSVPGFVPAPSRSLAAPTLTVDGVETVIDVETN